MATLRINGRPLTFSARIECCLKPGEVHPGPCKEHGPGDTITKIVKKAVAPKKAVAKKPKPKRLSPEQAQQMQNDMLAKEPWTPAQRDALHHYTEHGYVGMNGMLRGAMRYKTEETPEELKEYIRAAYHGMRPIPEPITVFRTSRPMRLGVEETKNRAKLLEGLRGLIGKQFQDKGFMSATIDERTGMFERFGDLRLEIELPAGTRLAYVEEITENPGEHEVVIAPGIKIEWTALDETKTPPVVKGRGIPA